ncbi:hypothetical protein AS189_04035 [Arthrobacter alpinus]|uniref:Uncharacterized protein n=1 Tax=Arthrobacter alpinus TaxID=656366 RepID=A0A0S2LWA3_9MICC|nr:hypothetical protein [Arthrobacter alpinus]ALO65812.1 hypothetical protein AS189_04035 [Arthrobacter alpinus]
MSVPATPVSDHAGHADFSVVPAVPVKSRQHLYFGLGGLSIGLVAGLLLAAGGAALGDAMASSNAIPAALEECSVVDATGVEVMDNGKSLNLRTSGEDSTGTDVASVVCVLNELEAPESIFTKLESTRALDGTQSTEWSGYAASWTYHPDNGLNIIVETAAK